MRDTVFYLLFLVRSDLWPAKDSSPAILQDPVPGGGLHPACWMLSLEHSASSSCVFSLPWSQRYCCLHHCWLLLSGTQVVLWGLERGWLTTSCHLTEQRKLLLSCKDAPCAPPDLVLQRDGKQEGSLEHYSLIGCEWEVSTLYTADILANFYHMTQKRGVGTVHMCWKRICLIM